MLTRVDHVILAVRDLDDAVSHFRDRFQLSIIAGGTHPGMGTANAIIPFDQGYLELITVSKEGEAPPGSFASDLATFLAKGEGLFGFALASSKLSGDVAVLRARGSSISDPARGEAERAGRRRGWSAAFHGDKEVPLPFLIQHEEPAQERWRAWADVAAVRQPLGLRAIEEVTVSVADVNAALTVYQHQLGLTANRVLNGRAQIGLPGSRILLIPQATTGVSGIGLHSVGLGVSDINACRDQLRRRRIDFREDPLTWSVSAQLDPGEVFGARIDFVQS